MNSKFVRFLPLILLAILCNGCGEVEWFPDVERLGTTPNTFSFPAKTETEKNVQVTSDPITVAGLTATSSPISVTGSVGSNSKYSINGATATDVAGTVANGDRVTVTHTSANILGTSTTSTLSIGNVNASFVSTTKLVEQPSFTPPTVVGVVAAGTLMQTHALITSVDGRAGTHAISISDSTNSGQAVYSVSDDLAPETFTSADQTIAILNGRFLFVRGLAPTTAVPVTTTLTINGTAYPVNLTPP